MSFAKRLDERRFVDECPARDVDQGRAAPEQAKLLRADQALRLGRVWGDQHHVVGPWEQGRERLGSVDLVCRDLTLEPVLGAALRGDNGHAKRFAETADPRADRPHPHDQDRLALQVATGEPFPPTFPLHPGGVEHATTVHQDAGGGEFGERLGVHARGGREDRVGHALRVSKALHELPDARARRLDPPHPGCEVGQVFFVGRIEVEEDGGLAEELAPPRLSDLATVDVDVRVVGGVARGREKVRFVEHAAGCAGGLDARDVLRLQVAGDDDGVHAGNVV